MSDEQQNLKAEKKCPLPVTHTRLRQSHDLWHRTAGAYPDPDEFVLNLNTLIVTLRQVTFMLQAEMARIPDFDAWYGSWQERMKADPLMKWLRDARTRVEKQGDLDLASTAKVSIVAGWMEGPYLEREVPPLLGPEEIAAGFDGDDLPEMIRNQGLVEVERRWVSKDLPGHELTDVCAHGYGVLATMLREAHQRCGVLMQTFGGEAHEGRHVRTAHLGGRLPCMLMTREGRTATIHLSSGKLVELGSREIDPSEFTDVEVERYRRHSEEMLVDTATAFAPRPGEDIIDTAARYHSIARRVLAHDGYHDPIAFMFDEDGSPLGMTALQFGDQGEKYLAFRGLAQEVNKVGAHGVLVISEVWQAKVAKDDLSPDMLRPTDRPDRTEALVTNVAASDGRHRSFCTPFTRDGKGRPVLSGTETIDREWMGSMEPIRRVWAQWPTPKAQPATSG